jgi:hypothetical protein
MMRKKLFIELGGFNEDLRRLEDYDFFCRFGFKGGRFLSTERVLCTIERGERKGFEDVLLATTYLSKKISEGSLNLSDWSAAKAYLHLERGAAHYYRKNYFSAIYNLFLSIIYKPRLRIQLRNWWSKWKQHQNINARTWCGKI